MYSLGNKAVPLFISWGVMLTKGATSSAVRGKRHSPFYKQHSLILVPKMTIPATDEEMRVGAIIRVEVPCTQSSESISVRGTVKWVDRMEFDIIGGIELINELNDLQLSRLEPFKSLK